MTNQFIHKQRTTFQFCCFLILLFSYSLISLAQSDKQSQEILKSISAKYKSFSSLKADFSYTIDNPKTKTNETQTGTIQLKGIKYKLEIKGQEVISDGKTVWTYLKDAKEVQINDVNTKEDAVTPSNIFTIYEKGFESVFVEEKKEGTKLIQIIDLKPVDTKKNYFKIRLTIDKNEKLVISTKIFDKNGNHYTYTIKQFSPNTLLQDALFTFNAANHPGVEVVDLR